MPHAAVPGTVLVDLGPALTGQPTLAHGKSAVAEAALFFSRPFPSAQSTCTTTTRHHLGCTSTRRASPNPHPQLVRPDVILVRGVDGVHLGG